MSVSVKEHYDLHLGNFYSWMLGDFEEKKNEFRRFCEQNGISPFSSKEALDLGAGHGIQTLALAELHFSIKAIDFNHQLLTELRARKNGLPIEAIQDDINNVSAYAKHQPELIICCGDTISHLGSVEEISQLLTEAFNALIPQGKIILSFRDYSHELKGTERFIPVKSDHNRILTCFLEYFPDKLKVTDILYERVDDAWQQKVSSYEKIRISQEMIFNILKDTGFQILFHDTITSMVTVIGQKNGEG